MTHVSTAEELRPHLDRVAGALRAAGLRERDASDRETGRAYSMRGPRWWVKRRASDPEVTDDMIAEYYLLEFKVSQNTDEPRPAMSFKIVTPDLVMLFGS